MYLLSKGLMDCPTRYKCGADTTGCFDFEVTLTEVARRQE